MKKIFLYLLFALLTACVHTTTNIDKQRAVFDVSILNHPIVLGVLERHHKECDDGALMSCELLGNAYSDGSFSDAKTNTLYFVLPDYIKSVYYRQKACSGYKENWRLKLNCSSLKRMYILGQGVEKDLEIVARYDKELYLITEENCARNKKNYCNDLAHIYLTGSLYKKMDLDKAKQYAKKACTLGEEYACSVINLHLFRGINDAVFFTEHRHTIDSCESGQEKSCKKLEKMFTDYFHTHSSKFPISQKRRFQIHKRACNNDVKGSCVYATFWSDYDAVPLLTKLINPEKYADYIKDITEHNELACNTVSIKDYFSAKKIMPRHYYYVPKICYQVAQNYEFYTPVKNMTKAATFYEKSCQLDYAHACVHLERVKNMAL